MVLQKIRVSVEHILVASIVARKMTRKMKEYRTLYLPLHKGTVQALNLKEGQVLTVGIIKKEMPDKGVEKE